MFATHSGRSHGTGFKSLKDFSFGLILIQAVVCLTLLGLVVLLSASQTSPDSKSLFFLKQIVFLGIALGAGVTVVFLDLDKLRRFTGLILGIVFTGLILVLLIGKEVNGARRWIDFGLLNLQVSEFAKLGLVFFTAHYLAAHQRHIKTFYRGFLIPSLMIGLVSGLIMLQPDFGTAFLCGAIGFVLLFLAGVRLLYLIPSLFVILGLFCMAIFFDPVRLQRITAFLDFEGNKSDGSYQLYQGILAYGAGGMKGVGLGNGRQQMAFLPEAHTDFIFPIIGEELGFFFTMGVVVLFLVIFLSGLFALRRAPNLFQFLLALGALLLIIFQALINMGVATGCLPTKGMSLPFISYGGSNLVLMFLLVGILVNCFRTWTRPAIRKPREL